jgi:transmembrane sensor
LSIVLTDGSTVLLDTASSIRARVGARERSVRLLAGRAQFQVVHNDILPFTVNVGSATIRDIGTRFAVRSDEAQVTVTVSEGAVAVSDSRANGTWHRSASLLPGEELVFSATSQLWGKQKVDAQRASGWTVGDLAFEDESLGTVLHEMNRYTRSQIRLGAPQLDAMRVSGVFHAGDQQSLLLALQGGWPVRAQLTATGDVIIFRR